MTEPITIGVDHGYAAMKTAHCSFPSGLAEYEHEPYTQKNVLCYDGKYYVVGSGRQPLQKDKLVHATDPVIICKYLEKLKHCKLNMAKLNKFRLLAGNCKLEYR